MTRTYAITGMTCSNCAASITEKIAKIDGVTDITIHLEEGIANIVSNKDIAVYKFADVLPDKYTINEKVSLENRNKFSKSQQLKPLFLIFVYLFGASFLMHIKNWNIAEAMLDFMGLFYIVFSFFKLLDLKGFKSSFRIYDPLAKVWPAYGWIYPFVELLLGIAFLSRFRILFALIITMVILGLTTSGVIKILLGKKKIQCACLGTVLKLPMTEATIIENAIMLLMAISMFFRLS